MGDVNYLAPKFDDDSSRDASVTVVCVLKSGGDYSPIYVRRLRAALNRNCRVPFEFATMTDMRLEGSHHFGQRIELTDKLPGWWSKMEVFKHSDRLGDILYIDLDTVIVGDITAIASMCGAMIMIGGFKSPDRRGSGLMHIPAGFGERIYEAFMVNPTEQMALYSGDQEFILSVIGDCATWQETLPGHIVSFKHHCDSEGYPNNARVVAFHGQPRPHEAAINTPWVERSWGIGFEKWPGSHTSSLRSA